MFDFSTRVVSFSSRAETASVIALLASEELAFDEGADYTALIEDAEGRLAATASLFGNVIRMVAVDPRHQEAGLSAVAISSLMETARVDGISHFFVFTKPDMATRFASLGFRNIAETDAVSLLELGEPGIGAFKRYLESNLVPVESGARIAAAVLNCNPFTLGHRYLIDTATHQCDVLYVIVVEEDLSVFPFEDRFEMVKLGTSGLANVHVIRSGHYAVSAATFPTYFLKGREPDQVAMEQMRLDVDLFLRLFVPILGVKTRFVGTEPDSPVTNLYNQTMKELLPPAGVEVREIPRLETPDGRTISASVARGVISAGKWDDARRYLPETTIRYIREKGICGG